MKLKNKNIIAMSVITIFMSAIVIFVLAKFGNTNQIFDEVISEYTAIDQSNKGLERTLLFGIIFVGIILYTIYYFFISPRITDTNEKKENMEVDKCKIIICSILAMVLTYFVISQGQYTFIIGVTVYLLLCALIDKSFVVSGFITYFMSVYSICAINRILVFYGNDNVFSISFIAVAALLISTFPLLSTNKAKWFQRACLIEETIVPFLLLLYLLDKYRLTDGSIVEIKVAPGVEAVILIAIAGFILEAVIKIHEYWNSKETNIGNIICIGACITIIAFNRFSGTGAIIPTDTHHPYENIIGFTQIFELGQKPFESYVPVSGMYSVVQGAILHFLGNEQFSNYHVTSNLFYLFVAIIIVILLRKNIEMELVFLISLTFYLIDYNRLTFVLPIMLLLSSPTLIENKNRWLNVWFLTSLLHGLYYPLYGVAVCIAFLPLGILQFITYVKSREYKHEIRTFRFWFGWIFSLILLFLSTRCLLGTLRHMLAMSGQSVIAEGVSRFGQILPEWLFIYLKNYEGIRYVLYYLLTWIPPALFVWVAFACYLKGGDMTLFEKKIKINNVKQACVIISIVIMPIICYTYTFTRLDMYTFYARSTGVLLAGCIMMLIYACRYLKNEKSFYFLIFFTFAISMIADISRINTLNEKLISVYDVPEGYVYVKNDSVNKIGTAFVEQDIYNTIKTNESSFADRDKEQAYMGIPGWFGYFYYANVKGSGTMEIIPTVKGLPAAEEAIDYITADHAIVKDGIDSFQNYYLYHWLLTSGKYYWNPDTREFTPNDNIYTKDEILNQNKNFQLSHDGLDIGRQASSFGESMENMVEIFTYKNIDYTVNNYQMGADIVFEKEINGEEADWLYLEFDEMTQDFQYVCFDNNSHYVQDKNSLSWLNRLLLKKDYNVGMIVEISWLDDNLEVHNMRCNMSKGKLLLPLGAGLKWLLNNHQSVHVAVYKNDKEITVPNIVNVQMLKLREAN